MMYVKQNIPFLAITIQFDSSKLFRNVQWAPERISADFRDHMHSFRGVALQV
jgi:hypothetical protein